MKKLKLKGIMTGLSHEGMLQSVTMELVITSPIGQDEFSVLANSLLQKKEISIKVTDED